MCIKTVSRTIYSSLTLVSALTAMKEISYYDVGFSLQAQRLL